MVKKQLKRHKQDYYDYSEVNIINIIEIIVTKFVKAEQLAEYTEYLQSNKTTHIGGEILKHIANFDDCAAEVIEFSFVSQEVDQSARKNKDKDTGLRFKKNHLRSCCNFNRNFVFRNYHNNIDYN